MRIGKLVMRYVFGFFLMLAFYAVPGAYISKAASIEGAWSGEGTVKLKAGGLEKIRCRIRYEKSTGRTFLVHVACAHTGGTFKVTGRIVELSPSSYSGRMYSDQYEVSGDVTVSMSGNSQTVKANSAKGTATMTLTKQ